MPAGKPAQSNAMLYTVVTFVALFIIAATCAVIFYVKAEEYRTQKETADQNLRKFADPSEQGNIAKVVGKTAEGKSAVGSLAGHIDFLVAAITGESAEALKEINASEKVNNAGIELNKALKELGPDSLLATGGQTQAVSLLQQIRALKAELDKGRMAVATIQKRLDDLQGDFDAAQEAWRQAEAKLIAEKDNYQQLADKVQKQYDDLKAQMDRSTEEQVANVTAKLDAAREQLGEREAQIQTLQSKLTETETALNQQLAKLEAIKPKPDIEVAAFQPDAKIVRIDLQTGVVYLNLGSDDHVYVGLTFAVYDKNEPIPEDGQGKAEIEVFNVGQKVSAARISRSSVKKPIVPEDIVANLIWDPKVANDFVIVGDFDFNQDGRIDPEGAERIAELVGRWGGRIVENVAIDTDFVIVGDEPVVGTRPTGEDLNADPDVAQRYQRAVDRSARYTQLVARARELSVPVFNQKRFLYLIGYESLAKRSAPM